MILLRKNFLSKVCILLVAVYWITTFTYHKRWEKNQIVSDVVSYYGYLPAVFIYHDISLKFADKDSVFFSEKYWPEIAPNGGRVIKTTMGLGYLYAPFFFMGHACAWIAGEPQDGFSVPYQLFLMISSLCYMVLGLFFLRSLLLKYFPDKITALTLLSVYFGTNLLYYSAADTLMAHAYIFSLSCAFLWAVDRWHRNPTIKISVLLGFTGGLLTTIRPTMILFVLIPVLFGIRDWNSLKEKIQFLKINMGKISVIIFAYILPGIPQLLYWKYITGNWFFFSYTNERFFWNHPHILEGLFSYQNGWLIYTPIMVFSIAGIFLMRKEAKQMRLPVFTLLPIFIYIFHCWWCYWFGGFGLRAYIDLYALLAIPMASFYDFFINRKLFIRAATLTIAGLLITLNVLQARQYEHGLIHWDSMTKKAYWIGFLKTHDSGGIWWGSLKHPNCERAKVGLSEFEEEDEVDAHRDVIVKMDFENVPKNADSLNYSSAVADRSKHSFVVKNPNTYSPGIDLLGEDILNDTSAGKRAATVQFYYKDGEIGGGESRLILSFDGDTGMYFYQAVDFFIVSPEPGKWNTATLEIPVDQIKNKKDKIKIYVWGPDPHREIFIDNLKYEIIRPKL